MKRIVFIPAILAIVSCSVREPDKAEIVTAQYDAFYATAETVSDPETKVYVDGDNKVLWHADDRISIFNHSTYNKEYRFTGQTGDNSGAFKEVSNDEPANGEAVSAIFAVYPFRQETQISSQDIISVTLPAEQSYTQSSFDPASSYMVAATSNNFLSFKNIGGVLVLRMFGSGAVSSISLKGNSNELLAGPAQVTMEVGGKPHVDIIPNTASTSVTLNCPEPVVLGESAAAATEFWIALPPTTFFAGFTVTMTNSDGWVFEKSTTKRLELKRSCIAKMAEAEVVFEAPKINLDSIVAVPDGGTYSQKWFRYNYIMGNYCSFTGTNVSAVDEEQLDAVVRSKNACPPGSIAYAYGSLSSAKYLVRPENYDLSDADWSLHNNDASTQWSPSIKSIERLDGESAVVSFALLNYNKMKGDGTDGFYLKATDKRTGAEVRSEATAVMPLKSQVKALGFSNNTSGADCGMLHNELFPTAKDAIENPASIRVSYDGGPIPLDFISIHLYRPDEYQANTVTNGEMEMSLAEFQALYPSMELRFQLVDYTIGPAAVSASSFGVISDNMFYPAYANASGTATIISPGCGGISSVGMKPVVLAQLVDKNSSKIIAAGYFKIKIVGPSQQSYGSPGSVLDFVMNDFGQISNIPSSTQCYTRWFDFYYTLLETGIGMSYSSFRSIFSTDGKTYIKNNGNFVASENYGTVSLLTDAGNSGVATDRFVLTVTDDQADATGSGKSKTVYCRLTSQQGADVYVGFSYTCYGVTASFKTKEPSNWYSDIDANMSTVRMHALIPEHYIAGDTYNNDVRIYYSNLKDYWTGSRITVSTTPTLPAVYQSSLGYYFKFSSSQPRINGKTLTVSNDGKTLYYSGTAIATLDDSILTYLCNSTSQQLLNWATNPSDSEPNARLLYCNVDLVGYVQNENKQKVLGTEQFHVRFLRPITFSAGMALDGLQAGLPGSGSYLEFCKYLSAEDWKGYKLFSYDSSNGQYVKGMYVGFLGPEVDWLGYYGGSYICVNLDGIMMSQDADGTRYYSLYTIAANAKVSLIDASTYNSCSSGIVRLPLDDLSRLSGYQLNYKDNTGFSGSRLMQVPVSFEYAWGTQSATLTIPVTGSN